MEIPRTKIIGKVVGKPGISFGRGVNCRITVEVPSDTGPGREIYDILITIGTRPWRVKEGARVGAVGVLKGNTLWCDSFWKY